jgi:hypothetical protein
MAFNRVSTGLQVAHVTFDFKGATKTDRPFGRFLYSLAKKQAEAGANVSVILPFFNNINPALKIKSKSEINVQLPFHSDKVTLDVSKAVLDGNPQNLTLYLIDLARAHEKKGFEKLFSMVSSGKTREDFDRQGEKGPIDDYVVFNRAAIELMKQLYLFIGHFHGWQTGLGAYFEQTLKNQGEENPSGMKVFFSPYGEDLGLFGAEQWKKLGLPREFFNMKTLEYYSQISLLKAGLTGADIITIGSESELAGYYESKVKSLPEIFKDHETKGKLTAVLDKEAVFSEDMEASASFVKNLLELYRSTMPFYSFSLNQSIVMGGISGQKFQIDSILRNIRGNDKEKRETIKLAMDAARTQVYTDARYKEVVLEGEEAGASGSALIKLFGRSELLEIGRNIVIMDGSPSVTNLGIMLAEGVKGQIQVLGRRLADQCAATIPAFHWQLPNEGLGWTFVVGNNNILITERVMTGRRPLNESKFGIQMFGVPVSIAGKSAYSPEVKELTSYGIMIADPITGELIEFRQKPSTYEVITNIQDVCYKNTYLFAVKDNIRKLMVKLYGAVKESEGKPLFDKNLDWVRHIISPMQMSREDWAAMYGKTPEDKMFSENEWHDLWLIAQTIKEASGGIGVANVGSKVLSFDTRMNEQFYELHDKVTRIGTPQELLLNKVLRKFFSLITVEDNDDVINAEVEGVRLPETKGTYLVYESVFKKGGIVGDNCVIIGSQFDEYVEIPNGTIIVGSKLGAISKQNPNAIGSVLYNYSASGPFSFQPGKVYASLYLKDGSKVDVEHPLNIDPLIAQEQNCTTYLGGRTFAQMIQEVSPKLSFEAQRVINNEILMYRRRAELGDESY